MPLAFNPMDSAPGNRSRRITSKRLAGNLLSIALGISLGILCVSLLLDPVQSYAAQAKLDITAVSPTRSSTVGPRAAREQVVASVDQFQPAPSESPMHLGKGAPNYSLDVLPLGKTVDGMVRLPGHVLSALQKATLLAPEGRDEAQPLIITIVLKRSDQIGFQRYLHDVYDSHSPQFRQFLSPRQVSNLFGPSRRTYDDVLAWLEGKGFRLIQGSASRLTLTVRGTTAQAEDAFEIRIEHYRIGNRSFFANVENPALPNTFASHVQAITGLSNLSRPSSPSSVVLGILIIALFVLYVLYCLYTFANGISGGALQKFLIDQFQKLNPFSYSPPTIGPIIPTGGVRNRLQDVPALGTEGSPAAADTCTWNNVDGTGQTIGLVEFDTFQTSDVVDYLAMIGAPTSQLSNLSQVHVNGGATLGPNQNEVLLDIDDVLTIAPGAKVAVYDAPFGAPGASFQALLSKMIDDGVTIISNSWSYCEDQTDKSDVDSIDALFQTAAASGITVFNAAGDSGSICLDGSPNTIGVPADSPNAIAVGGTSLTPGQNLTYGSETWWNGQDESPTSGQGGFGISKFFARPPYQDTFVTNPMRSVPDLSVNADPAHGVLICQASGGGCPTGLLNGGTSGGAPTWAAFQALLNQSVGKNLGFISSAYYNKCAETFHSPASMGSDFAHVGLGSPNLADLHLCLCGQTVGPPDATNSQVLAIAPLGLLANGASGVPADGSKAGVEVKLIDGNGIPISGKTVQVVGNAGSHVVITPTSGVTSSSNGSFVFTVSDVSTETVTFTATDKSDSIGLPQKPTLPFVTPPAASAALDAFPASVAADGVTNAVITVTLKDSLGRPSPDKLVNISQGSGHSLITGPIPSVTNASGQVEFTAVDQVAETITYSAVDITDGNLPFPTTGTVDFTGGPANGCGNAAPPAAPGFLVTPYATGFITQNYSYGDIDFSCGGAYGMAFDAAGNLYVSYGPTGDIYKFKPGGGVADATTLLTTTALGPSLQGLAFDKKGNLFASRDATTPDSFNTGAVFQIDPSNGTILRTVASDLTCPSALSVDPLSGDLFTDDSCFAPADNPDMWRIVNPDGASPKTTVYATLQGSPNVNISFAPSGTIYAWAFSGLDGTGVPRVAQITGTNVPAPPTESFLPNFQLAALGLLAMGTQANGDAEYLFLNPYDATTSSSLGIGTADLTTNPPSAGVTLATGNGATNFITGPDGCVYAAAGDGVFKITDSAGACNYAAPSQPPSLVLAPPTISPNPAQGTSQTFTASFHYTEAPLGTPIYFNVAGANPQFKMARSDANGTASFSYAGVFTGIDTITAVAALGKTNLTSNESVLTWTSGLHTSFLTLNLSPTSVTAGKQITLVASLTDASVTPPAPVPDVSVHITLEGTSCVGITDAKGNASCNLTPTIPELTSQTASFVGNPALIPATATKEFNVTGPPTTIPTFTPRPTGTVTSTPKPTPTLTPIPTPIVTHTPTPTPTPSLSQTPTPTPTPPECIATTPIPTVPVPTPTPLPGHPRIKTVQSPVLAGASFLITGSGFTKGSEVNFFVSTSSGSIHEATLKPAASSSATELTVPVPATISLGQGFVSVVVVNTDQVSFPQSNPGFALLQGSAAAGLPSITGLDGDRLAATSLDPDFAVANVETTLLQGSSVMINGNGFDTTHGVAVDVFCACPETGGKLKTQFLNAGNAGLKPDSITFTLPATTPTGPGSIIVSNAAGGSYSAKSNAVSVPLGARINVTKVTQSGRQDHG